MSGEPLLDVDDARNRLLALLPEVESEEVVIEDAIGRALTQDVLARRTLPPWNNSAMDGYAVRASDVATAGTRLPVSQVIYAGDLPQHPLAPMTAARIMTGAPLPE